MRNLAVWKESHAWAIRQRLDGYILPPLGNLHLPEIRTRDYAKFIAAIEARGRLKRQDGLRKFAARFRIMPAPAGFASMTLRQALA